MDHAIFECIRAMARLLLAFPFLWNRDGLRVMRIELCLLLVVRPSLVGILLLAA